MAIHDPAAKLFEGAQSGLVSLRIILLCLSILLAGLVVKKSVKRSALGVWRAWLTTILVLLCILMAAFSAPFKPVLGQTEVHGGAIIEVECGNPELPPSEDELTEAVKICTPVLGTVSEVIGSHQRDRVIAMQFATDDPRIIEELVRLVERLENSTSLPAKARPLRVIGTQWVSPAIGGWMMQQRIVAMGLEFSLKVGAALCISLWAVLLLVLRPHKAIQPPALPVTGKAQA